MIEISHFGEVNQLYQHQKFQEPLISEETDGWALAKGYLAQRQSFGLSHNVWEQTKVTTRLVVG